MLDKPDVKKRRYLVVSIKRGSPREEVIEVSALCTDPSLSINEINLLKKKGRKKKKEKVNITDGGRRSRGGMRCEKD